MGVCVSTQFSHWRLCRLIELEFLPMVDDVGVVPKHDTKIVLKFLLRRLKLAGGYPVDSEVKRLQLGGRGKKLVGTSCGSGLARVLRLRSAPAIPATLYAVCV
jgi:hypothetical protein